jgi:hypothetical protein
MIEAKERTSRASVVKEPQLHTDTLERRERSLAEVHGSSDLGVRTPHEIFEKTMGRVDALLLLDPHLRGVGGRSRRRASDMLRGAFVLSVSALDGLVLDSVVAAIPRAEQEGTLDRTIATWAKADAEAFLALLGDREPGEKVAELCRRKLGQPALHRAAAIEDVIRDVAKRDPPWGRAAKILSADGIVWNDTAVKEKLDGIIERAHCIAYRGDLLPSSRATRRIQVRYVDEAAHVVRAVGSGVAQTLA